MDEQVYEYFGIDPSVFKDMSRDARNRKKQEAKELMFRGEKEPADKKFYELKTGDKVLANVSLRTPILEGSIRMAYAKDSYVIEHEELGVLTWDMMFPDRDITSHKPYIFEISMPNHHKVFRNMKALEMAQIKFLTEHSKRSHIPITTLIGKVKEMLDKYPEEFI